MEIKIRHNTDCDDSYNESPAYIKLEVGAQSNDTINLEMLNDSLIPLCSIEISISEFANAVEMICKAYRFSGYEKN